MAGLRPELPGTVDRVLRPARARPWSAPGSARARPGPARFHEAKAGTERAGRRRACPGHGGVLMSKVMVAVAVVVLGHCAVVGASAQALDPDVRGPFVGGDAAVATSEPVHRLPTAAPDEGGPPLQM